MANDKAILNFLIEPELLKRVDDFRFKQRFATRSGRQMVAGVGIEPEARGEGATIMAEDLNTRVARLEDSQGRAWAAIEALADKEAKIDETLLLLTEAQIKLAQAQQATETRFQTDARIDKLVSAIGESIPRRR
jgi:hypothetical protein